MQKFQLNSNKKEKNMFRKISILILSLSVLSSNAFALVGFGVENAPFIGSLKVEDNLMLITDKKEDFIVLYNKKNEVIYYKHKKLPATYKTSLFKIQQTTNPVTVKPEKSSLELLGYETKLSSVKVSGRTCFQIRGSQDLTGALDSSASSAFAVYQGFVYMTGQLQMDALCRTAAVNSYLDENIGFPLALFYNGKQAKLKDMQNESVSMKQYLAEHHLDMKKAKAPSLDLQYEMLFSLLTEKQQETFLQTSTNKPISVKIKAIDNLLRGF